MSRDNHFSSHQQHRSRSRSFSAYRYDSTSSRQHRILSPGPPPPRFSHRSESPLPVLKTRFSGSHSPLALNGSRNGHRSRTPEKRMERRPRKRSLSVPPEPSPVLGVFGLHVRTSEGEIRDLFERYGPVDKIHMVYDAKSNGFRGYCFIYFTKIRDATTALNETNGLEVKDRRIRVDYSKTKRAHTPTPGFYRGNRGQRNRSMDRARPPRRDFGHSGGDRFRREERPRSRERRSRERVMERPYRDMNRDRETRHRSDVRRRSMERGLPHRSPPRRSPRRVNSSNRRRDRS